MLQRVFLIVSVLLVCVFAAAVVMIGLGLLEPAFAQTAVATVTAPADAPTSTQVLIPAGDWVTWTLNNLKELLSVALFTALSWAAARAAMLVPALKNVLTAALMEQISKRSIDFAIAATEGAVKGKVVSIDVANEILHKGVQTFADNAPTMFRKFSDTIRPKLIARMGENGIVPPEATVAPITAPQMVIDAKGITVLEGGSVLGFVKKAA